MRYIYLILILILSFADVGFAQSLKGTVSDAGTGESIPLANIVVKSGQTIVQSEATDFDGRYIISPLSPGTYNVEVSYIGYTTKNYTGVIISPSKSTQLNVKLEEDGEILEVVELVYTQPIIDADKTGSVVTIDQLAPKPIKSVSGLVVQTAGVAQSDQGASLSVRGGRSEGTVYFVDGVRVTGTPNNTIQVTTGGVPSEYGDVSSGVIHIKNQSTLTDDFTNGREYLPNKNNSDISIEDSYRDESYEEIIENEFLNSSHNPVTTFSIDVDRASYTNFRRFVNNGIEPPRQSVRLEEFVNYFDYNYPKPEENIINTYSELSTCPWNPNNQLLHIGLQSKDIESDRLQSSNLVFLIDVSGSMSSQNKLPLVKKTLTMVTNQLKKNDKISIVVYAGAAGCVLQPTSGDNKHKILNALNNLHSGGSTAGGEGIELAYKMATKHFIRNGNNRVILATDGDFNVGASSREDLEDLIAKKRASNVFLTVLGYGMGNYKDDNLELLADKGNGNYAYIDNLQEAEEFLVRDFNSTLFTLAKDVKLQLEFNPEYVKEYRLIGYENRALKNRDFTDDTKDAGELGANQSVTALYEIVPAKNKNEDLLKYQRVIHTSELCNLKIRYKEPKGKESIEFVQPIQRKVIPLDQTSDRFRFSAAVAMFGHVLRGSKYKGNASCKDVIDLAKNAKAYDDNGYKGEFVRLVRTYKNSIQTRSDINE